MDLEGFDDLLELIYPKKKKDTVMLTIPASLRFSINLRNTFHSSITDTEDFKFNCANAPARV